MEKKLHVVLDTNAWVGGIVFKKSISRRLLNCWEANEFFALVSKEIVSVNLINFKLKFMLKTVYLY